MTFSSIKVIDFSKEHNLLHFFTVAFGFFLRFQKLQQFQPRFKIQTCVLRQKRISKTLQLWANLETAKVSCWWFILDHKFQWSLESLNCKLVSYNGSNNYTICKRFAVQTLLWSLEWLLQYKYRVRYHRRLKLDWTMKCFNLDQVLLSQGWEIRYF